jgi:hypothetical protein
MNRQIRRAQAALSRRQQKALPVTLTPVREDVWPDIHGMSKKPIAVWQSREFLVQLYDEKAFNGIAVNRATICRVTVETNNDWTANIKWEDIQKIKTDIGFGNWYALEIYPRNCDVVNVANMRHLWMLAAPLNIGWFKP